ncbi:type VI secretion system membrane subunit TssM [Campylobacter lari]|nr:type VI secretion system membrane subunit TssM [Campylobacter lari]
MFQKIMQILKSRIFVIILILIILVVLSLFFWAYGSLFAFNEIYVFSNSYLRFGIIFIFWCCIFLFFLLKPLSNFIKSFKDDKRIRLKEIKKESNEFLYKAKRNFFIALKDAKQTWKKDINTKNLPLVVIVGNEGAGKSTFINYSDIEYPLSDSLESYKKMHKSTNNFSLYVSKKGALLDTEGNYFSQEDFFHPNSSDELPEDDIEKNRDFLIKKSIWQNFLKFLNKNYFHSKLNGIILIIDTRLFLENTKEYSNNLIRYLTKRVHECEKILGVQLPIYVVFSKLDLIEGMREFFDIFNEKIQKKAFGISFAEHFKEEDIQKSFEEISKSLFLRFVDKNSSIYTIEEKNKIYLFLKQLDNLFVLSKDFIVQLQNENILKNSSVLRGVYYVSAYQENVPRNFMLDTICEKYNIKKPLAQVKQSFSKQSYFVQSLLEDIVFKDSSLSRIKSFYKKISLVGLTIFLSCMTYFISSYFILKSEQEKKISQSVYTDLSFLLKNMQDYPMMSIEEKAKLLVDLRNILSVYPQLIEKASLFEYFSLNITYKGFKKAQNLYYKISEDVLKNTLLKEMEIILQTDDNYDNLIKTLYVYKSLFEQKYLDKDLLKIWINENWNFLEKYKISKENFLSGIDELQKIDLSTSQQDDISVKLSIEKLYNVAKIQRIYTLLNFIILDKKNKVYNFKNELGFAANNVFSESIKIDSIEEIYTKKGMADFLQTLNVKIDKAIEIDSWILNDLSNSENRSNMAMGIIKIYLTQYQNKWQEILNSLAPKKFISKSSMLNELNILSKKENPLMNFIKIVSVNTNLNDATLLTQAYNLGVNAAEIKTSFMGITSSFDAYHKIIEQNSILNTGVTAVGLDVGSHQKTMELINTDLSNIHKKITDFTTNNSQTIEEKIKYALSDSKDSSDPFSSLEQNIKNLPSELEKYYVTLSLYAWNIIENHGVSLFNTVWLNEVYAPFVNDIAPFYPFNLLSSQDLSIDSFKNFFGKNGILNKFYEKYLTNVLIKRKNVYSINSKFSSRLTFSKEFLDFITKAGNLSELMLNANDVMRVRFTLQSLDLSADFSFVKVQYNDTSIIYDHTLHTKLDVITDEFNNGTSFDFTAYSYLDANINYTKSYKGEWAWYKLLQESKNSNSSYSVLFNDNKKMYFDFKLNNNNSDINNIIMILSDFKIVENITKAQNDR